MNRSTFIKSLLLSIPVIGAMIKAKADKMPGKIVHLIPYPDNAIIEPSKKGKLYWSGEPMNSRIVFRNGIYRTSDPHEIAVLDAISKHHSPPVKRIILQ